MQSSLVTIIFRAYCEDDLDINDAQVLADAAEQAGMMSRVEVSMSSATVLAAGAYQESSVSFSAEGRCISIRKNRTSLRYI